MSNTFFTLATRARDLADDLQRLLADCREAGLVAPRDWSSFEWRTAGALRHLAEQGESGEPCPSKDERKRIKAKAK